MTVLRTPDEAFDNLPDFPFSPNYVETPDGLRMHYLDEGEGPVVVLLHGEPSWSFLYRKMIPILVDGGFRCIAPDLIGFGRSDKPIDPDAYTYASHEGWLTAGLSAMGLGPAHLFCQDWGGLLGLRLVARQPDQFLSVCAANTFLPVGNVGDNPAFMKWREFSQSVPELPVGGIIKGGTARPMSEAAIAGYDAPYPDESYKAAARKFPTLVPLTSDDPEARINAELWANLSRYEAPFLTLFGDSDPIMLGAEKFFQQRVPGAAGQPHAIIEQAAHFIQEDAGEELATRLVEWLSDIPAA